MFAIVSDRFALMFDFFVKMDTDTYMNVANLRRHVIEKLQRLDNAQPRYIGYAGMGRPGELDELGLNGHPYVFVPSPVCSRFTCFYLVGTRDQDVSVECAEAKEGQHS